MSETPATSGDAWAKALGRSIKVQRTDLGMSRRQLANAAAISYSYMSAIENGTKAPSTKILRVIAARLHLQPQDLLTDVDRRLAQGDQARDAAVDDVDSLVERQERRFLERQQVRMGLRDRPGSSRTHLEELMALDDALGDDDYRILVAVAEGLIARKLRPGT